jgi:hypothetical protein
MRLDPREEDHVRKPYIQLAISGAASGALYFALYRYELEIMQVFTRTDGFYPALPILAAFVFSFAHGAFAGYVWETLGIRPRRSE